MADEPYVPEEATPNQVVAYNLWRVRKMVKGWTQEQAAKKLKDLKGDQEALGLDWSKASFSAAERSMSGTRVRKFSADEILSFALVFDVPVAWFFLPPPGVNPVGPTTEAILGTDAGLAVLEERLNAPPFSDLAPEARLRIQHRLHGFTGAWGAAMQQQIASDLSSWSRDLRDVADYLDQLADTEGEQE